MLLDIRADSFPNGKETKKGGDLTKSAALETFYSH